uniref:Uncharacterized protein n=1 Tax=Homalodisca liturata TaxID=320908 RepID=A0A1B6J567_9HEMI
MVQMGGCGNRSPFSSNSGTSLANTDSYGRPTFKELADEFAKMARDPGRYLVIHGDRFMRLPSYNSSQEDKEAVSAEGSESVDTDEYLQPKTQPESPTPQNQTNWDREMMRYAVADPSRYCPQPIFKDTTELDDNSTGKREAQVGALKLELPLDEDDYLMPSPQQSQAPSTYMDLIGDSKLPQPEPVEGNGILRNYNPDFLPPQTSVDNPEYHLVGVPHTPASAPHPVAGPCHKSSEEESDHEYYNDFDRLQRELQPLRRNETTV